MKHLITSIIFLLCLCFAKANNIQISNISIVAASNTIKFDVSWENSWRSTALENWDAAYVFFKYKSVNGEWLTVQLTSTGDVIPVGCIRDFTTNSGFYKGGRLFYQNAPFAGTSTFTNIQLGIPTLLARGINDIKVFAIEMVRIPTSIFSVGDGVSTNSYPLADVENNVAIYDPIISSTYYPDGRRNGYRAFYSMKYELSQGGYRDFLNTLTFGQQVNHMVSTPSLVAGTAALYNTNRNSLKIKTSGISATNIGAVIGCDANNNGIYDEAEDGEWVACNFLSWFDQAAYLAWAGLAPMTETQYEKAARGIQLPVAGEYAWGNTNIFTGSPFYTTSNANQASEIMSNASASPTGNTQYVSSYDNLGPTRNGVFATATSNRISSGGSFYGVMELSGNLWERVATTANNEGKFYYNSDSTYARGNLSSNGLVYGSNYFAWPGSFSLGPAEKIINGTSSPVGIIYRGGGWNSPASQLRVSDRSGLLVLDANNVRSQMGDVGVRGVLESF
jgi:formylglycine-generating enzyme required for sulfatase activity